MSREFESHAASLRMTAHMQVRWLAKMADSPHLHQQIETPPFEVAFFLTVVELFLCLFIF
jgi:hypothetical protein